MDVLGAAGGRVVETDALIRAMYAGAEVPNKAQPVLVNVIGHLRGEGYSIRGSTRLGYWLPRDPGEPPPKKLPDFNYCIFRRPSGAICGTRFKPEYEGHFRCRDCAKDRRGDDLTVFSISTRGPR